jgi:hypothetical protein
VRQSPAEGLVKTLMESVYQSSSFAEIVDKYCLSKSTLLCLTPFIYDPGWGSQIKDPPNKSAEPLSI